MTPEDFNAALESAQEIFTPIQGKSIDEDIITMVNLLLLILLNIPYDSANTKHNLIGFISSCDAYVACFNVALPQPDLTGNYDPGTRESATVFNRSRYEVKGSYTKVDHALL